MFYYVYVLHSSKFNRLYIGYSTDLKRRFREHNRGKSSATKPFRPYRLIFYEAFLNTNDAKQRERYLKSGWGRRSLRKMLADFYLENPQIDLAEIS